MGTDAGDAGSRAWRPTSRPSRSLLLLLRGTLTILFGLLAVGVVLLLVNFAVRAVDVASWETTPGVVKSRFVAEIGVLTEHARIAVEYLDFEVSCEGVGGSCSPSTSEKTGLPVGTELTVWYDPADPTDFTLTGSGERWLKQVGPSAVVAAVLIGLTGVTLGWKPWRRWTSPRHDMSTTSPLPPARR